MFLALYDYAGPDFGAPPSFMRKKLLTVLSDSRKVSSIIDDVSIVKRYSSNSSHSFPISSDDEALSKARKEVKQLLIGSVRFPLVLYMFWPHDHKFSYVYC